MSDAVPIEAVDRLNFSARSRTPLAMVENGLNQLDKLVRDWGIKGLLSNEAGSRHFREIRLILKRRIGHLSCGYPLRKHFEALENPETANRTLSNSVSTEFLEAVAQCRKRLSGFKPEQFGGQLITDDEIVSHLQLIRRTCQLSITGTDLSPLTPEYTKFRDRLIEANPYLMPLTVFDCVYVRNFQACMQKAGSDRESRAVFIDQEFDEILTIISQQPLKEEGTVTSASWTGRRTVDVQVKLIKAFAPTVMDSLNELIALHERLGNNDQPHPRQLEALALMRELHRDIGELLDAVDARKPHSKLAQRVRGIGARLFSLKADTKELLLLGAPALVATTLTLGVVKGLEYLCGFDLGETETAGIATVAGGVFAAHSVRQAVARDKSME